MSATRRGVGLAGRIFTAAIVLVVAVLGISLGLTSLQARRTSDAAIATFLRRTHRTLTIQLGQRADALGRLGSAAAAIPQFRNVLFSRDLSDRVSQAEEYRIQLGAAFVLATDAEGILLARTDYPDESGSDFSRGALVGAALAGEDTRGAFIDDRDSTAVRLYLAVGTPLRDSPVSAPRGVLVAAFALDDSLAADLAGALNTDVAFFALDREGAPLVVGSTLPRDEVQAALRAGLDVGMLAADTLVDAADAATIDTVTATIGGDVLIGLPVPVRSAAGDLYGGAVAFRPRDAELAAFRALRNMIWVALGIGFALALVAAFLLARQIAGPVRRLAEATRRVQDGDYSVELPTGGRDEIGSLARAFKALVDDLKEKQDLVEYMMAASGAAATQPIEAAATEIRALAGRPSVMSGGDALRPGSVFANRYEIKEILGMGGMGVVYRAVDRELGEAVAVKTLRTDTLADDGVALERFKQEIRLARKITHRNVVRTYDLGEVNGTYYLTMEFVEGTSLKQLIQGRGKLPVPVALTVGKQLCRALEVAHEEGVIHRDIKPQNIVVEPSGFIKVMDFGIARLTNPPQQQQGLTQAGTSIGTPDYMSPEQLLGEELDPRSDLYSAGVVLFECLAGRPPFEADTVYALVAKHLEEAPPDPRTLNRDVSPELAALVLRAMAKKRDERFTSAAEMGAALSAIEG